MGDAKADLDQRLDQKVTYNSGCKRLSVIVSELGKMIGVDIYCGKNSQDWRVRDIPATVNVKDLPLGKLLQLLADTTHTQLTSKVSDSQTSVKEKTYRLSRNLKQEADITSHLNTQGAVSWAGCEWAWDSLVKAADAPQSVDVPAEARNIGKLFKSLGSEAKEKVFSANKVTLNVGSAPQAALLRELCHWAWTVAKKNADWQPTQEEIDASTIRLSLFVDPTGAANQARLAILLIPAKPENMHYTWGSMADVVARPLEKIKELNLPSYPNGILLATEDEIPDKSLKMLKTDGDWNLPELQTKINLKKPADPAQPTFSDSLAALAEASGLNIICEDFISHKSSQYSNTNDIFGYDTTAAEALKKLHKNIIWFINPKERIMIGWIGNSYVMQSQSWRTHHVNLVPADYLTQLRTKLKGDGVELDDVTPLASMTNDSLAEWFLSQNDLMKLIGCCPRGDLVLWRLYDALTPQDKALAKSEAGLPLAKLDPVWVSRLIEEIKFKESMDLNASFNNPGTQANKEADRSKREIMSDPKKLLSMTMWIKSSQVMQTVVDLGELKPSSNHQIEINADASTTSNGHSYYMELGGEDTSGPYQIRSDAIHQLFPVRSHDRS